MQNVSIPPGQKVLVSVTDFQDQYGNPVVPPMGASAMWSSDTWDVAQTSPVSGTLTAWVSAPGPSGSAIVSVTVAAGSQAVQGQLSVTVGAGPWAKVGFSFGSPVPI